MDAILARSLTYTQLPGTPYAGFLYRELHDRAFHFWMDFWANVFRNNGSDAKPNPDDFLRQQAIENLAQSRELHKRILREVQAKAARRTPAPREKPRNRSSHFRKLSPEHRAQPLFLNLQQLVLVLTECLDEFLGRNGQKFRQVRKNVHRRHRQSALPVADELRRRIGKLRRHSLLRHSNAFTSGLKKGSDQAASELQFLVRKFQSCISSCLPYGGTAVLTHESSVNTFTNAGTPPDESCSGDKIFTGRTPRG